MAEFITGNALRKLARNHSWLSKLLWRIDFLLVWLLISLCRLLPVDLASRFGEWTGKLVGPRMKQKSALFRGNYKVAFPDLDEQEITQLIRQSWGRAGRIMAEYPHLKTILNDPERLKIVIVEPIETYSNPSKPCVMISAHQSNWEVVCSAMARMGIPNASLYSPPSNPYLDGLLRESREALNCDLLPRDNSARLLVKALKQGRTAGLVMDRRVDEGPDIEFFGHAKPSTILPARLAQIFNCDLVPVQVERIRDARYKVTFHPPIRAQNPEESENQQAIDMIQQAHAYFETWARHNPTDWFCSKRLWPRDVLKKNFTNNQPNSVS